MGLTARKSLALDDSGLIELFESEQDQWRAVAHKAHDYVEDSLDGSGEPVRRDDLIPMLVPVLEVTAELREFLAEEKLTQKYWYEWFAELMVDRLWDELREDEDDEDDEDDEEDD
jgi:hypothetical protein